MIERHHPYRLSASQASRLRVFLDEAGLGVLDEDSAAPLGAGESNITLELNTDAGQLVLRRPPEGPLSPKTHDVIREARILEALSGRFRVPKVLTTCMDVRVLGAPFFIMERVDGCVITRTVPPQFDTTAHRRAVSIELVETLADLHHVDWKSAGLDGLAPTSDYLARQVDRFERLWHLSRVTDIDLLAPVTEFLKRRLPSDNRAPAVVHGDYRLGNVVLASETPARLVAVLDWEMATLGDGWADLGYLLALWADPADPQPDVFESATLLRQDGFLQRDEVIAVYEDRSGMHVRNIDWYLVLALWKAAIFTRGNARRAHENGRAEAARRLSVKAEAITLRARDRIRV
jgi:aminoglycoside phosphotransferase (APT) family kinase protein